MRIAKFKGSHMDDTKDYFADLRNQWTRYDPRKHLPPYDNPTWPQLGPPVRRRDVDPFGARLIDTTPANQPIPPRFEAAATMRPDDWVNSYERMIKSWAPSVERPARYVRDSIADILAKPGAALSEGARKGSEAFSRHVGEMENSGAPSWYAVPQAVAKSLPDLGYGAWRGLTEPGFYLPPGYQATRGLENPSLASALQMLINTIAIPRVLPHQDLTSWGRR
jgi:hypothetical protein